MNYLRFVAMVATATVIMFGLMYLNTEQWAHVRYSETRTYMALVMGATMGLVMLGFMKNMYANRGANVAILVASLLLFGSALYLVRSQETVDDVSWMKAMIPHHSIAILTSERAELTDPRVRDLADEIIASQTREIREMEDLIRELERDARQPREAPAPTSPQASR